MTEQSLDNLSYVFPWDRPPRTARKLQHSPATYVRMCCTGVTPLAKWTFLWKQPLLKNKLSYSSQHPNRTASSCPSSHSSASLSALLFAPSLPQSSPACALARKRFERNLPATSLYRTTQVLRVLTQVIPLLLLGDGHVVVELGDGHVVVESWSSEPPEASLPVPLAFAGDAAEASRPTSADTWSNKNFMLLEVSCIHTLRVPSSPRNFNLVPS